MSKLNHSKVAKQKRITNEKKTRYNYVKATKNQKNYMRFLGIAFPKEISKESAAILISKFKEREIENIGQKPIVND